MNNNTKPLSNEQKIYNEYGYVGRYSSFQDENHEPLNYGESSWEQKTIGMMADNIISPNPFDR